MEVDRVGGINGVVGVDGINGVVGADGVSGGRMSWWG